MYLKIHAEITLPQWSTIYKLQTTNHGVSVLCYSLLSSQTVSIYTAGGGGWYSIQ